MHNKFKKTHKLKKKPKVSAFLKKIFYLSFAPWDFEKSYGSIYTSQLYQLKFKNFKNFINETENQRKTVEEILQKLYSYIYETF